MKHWEFRWRSPLGMSLGSQSRTLSVVSIKMVAPAIHRSICTQRLSLLCRWLALSEGYSRVVIANVSAKSSREREFLLAVIDEMLTQIDDVRRELELHRVTHGCW